MSEYNIADLYKLKTEIKDFHERHVIRGAIEEIQTLRTKLERHARQAPASGEVEQAYMQGQVDAGIDPSFSNAKAYAESVGCTYPPAKVPEDVIAAARGYLLSDGPYDWSSVDRAHAVKTLANRGLLATAPSQAVRSGVPELTSGIVNDCCWTFVEAMPHTLPGPIFNDVKPALCAAIKQYHETVLSTTPHPAAQAPDGYVLVEKGITPIHVAEAGLKCFRLLNQSGIADDRTIVLSVFQDMLLAASNPPAEGEGA